MSSTNSSFDDEHDDDDDDDNYDDDDDDVDDNAGHAFDNHKHEHYCSPMYVHCSDCYRYSIGNSITKDATTMNIHDHDYDYDHGHLKTVANICIPPVNNEGRVRPPRGDLLSASGQAQDSKVLPVEHGQVVDQPSPHVHNHRRPIYSSS